MGLFAATSLGGEDIGNDPVIELEAFIVEETARTQPETLSPLSMRVDSIFGRNGTVLDIPRSVTVLSPELQDLLQINSYEDLEKFGAGTQRVNYFGLAGSAFLRGARAGTYFNGMLRAYQRNEMPMSFGSLDGLELIKGPVPPGFSPTLVGGAVNQRPKSPYYDRARGSVEVTLGSWDEREVRADYGAPFMLFDKPAAYRVSYTHHRSGRYYEDVPHDFDSLYGAIKTKLNDRHRLFLGGELYRFRSSEIPGMNRPTPGLIENRQYVIGEPASLVSSAWGGTVVRPLLEFPYSLTVNPALFALALPGDIARQEIEPGLLGSMLNLNDPSVLESLYTTLPESEVPGFARWAIQPAGEFLSQVDKSPQDAYLYTPGFFAAGGEALTRQLPAERVLADPKDKANSNDLIAFADLESLLEGGNRLLSRFFIEHLDTTKASTYGFAMNTRQLVMEAASEWQSDSSDGQSHMTFGASLRYTDAHMLQDFDAEPFSRRDISLSGISSNSVVLAGGAIGPDGLNYWSSFGNASQDSVLFQTAAYMGGEWRLGERLGVHFGGRIENAWWDVALPDEVDRASDSRRQASEMTGEEVLWQVSLNPQFELAKGLIVYGAAQIGKALAPGDGGTVSGESSFTDAELFEAGLKASLLEGRLFMAISAYHWDQATFSNRDASARPLRAKGFELEGTYSLNERISFLGAFTAQRVYLRTDTLGFGAIPQSEQGWALNGGILNASSGRSAPENPEMIFAGVPELSAHLYAVISLPSGFTLSGGPLWRDGYYHDMQRAMKIPSYTLWSLQLRYDTERWWARIHIENLFDKEYWIGQEPVFSAGTLVLQGEGRKIQVSAGINF